MLLTEFQRFLFKIWILHVLAEFLKQLVVSFFPGPDPPEKGGRGVGAHNLLHIVFSQIFGNYPSENHPVIYEKKLHSDLQKGEKIIERPPLYRS